MNGTKRWVLAACVVLAGFGGAVVASGSSAGGSGGVRFGVSVSAHSIRYRGRPVLLTVTMRTGGTAETVALGLSESGWPDPQVFGSPLVAGPARVHGAGRVTGGFAAGGASLPGPTYCLRGAYPDDGGITLSLPADTLTTVTYEVRLAAPLWPGVRPTIGAYVSVPAVNPGGAWREIGRAALSGLGRTGVRISLGAGGSAGGSVIAGRGHALLITGATRPAVAHARLRIVAVRYALQAGDVRPHRVVVGTVWAGFAGTFAVVWRPRLRGIYLITASLLRDGAGYVVDSGCDLTVSTR